MDERITVSDEFREKSAQGCRKRTTTMMTKIPPSSCMMQAESKFVLDEAGTDGGDANMIGFPLPLSTL